MDYEKIYEESKLDAPLQSVEDGLPVREDRLFRKVFREAEDLPTSSVKIIPEPEEQELINDYNTTPENSNDRKLAMEKIRKYYFDFLKANYEGKTYQNIISRNGVQVKCNISIVSGGIEDTMSQTRDLEKWAALRYLDHLIPESKNTESLTREEMIEKLKKQNKKISKKQANALYFYTFQCKCIVGNESHIVTMRILEYAGSSHTPEKQNPINFHNIKTVRENKKISTDIFQLGSISIE